MFRVSVFGHRRDIVLATLLLMSHQVGESLVPYVLGQAIDRAVEPGDGRTLAIWIAVLAGTFAWLSLSWRFGHICASRAEQRGAHDLRMLVAQRVMHPGGGLSATRMPGELLNIATSDTRQAAAAAFILAGGAGAVMSLLVASVILLRVSTFLGLVILLGLPPLLFILHLLGRPLEGRASHEQSHAARATSIATDLVTGLRILKGIGAEQAGATRYERASRDSLRAAVRAARLFAAYEAWALLLTGVFLALVAYVGGWLAVEGRISIGDLVAAVGLTQFLIGPLTRLAFSGAAVARARASAVRIAAVLDTPPAVEGGPRSLGDGTTAVTLRGVANGSLRDLSLHVEAGELLGVVALDPSDARALAEVLAHDVRPSAGGVSLGGVPLEELALAEARRMLVTPPQDAAIFAGPLVQNVAPGGIENERLQAVATASAVETVIAELPGGWEAPVTERGRSLSGGQRQRITLARALAADPPVLVLHDPTTAVDSVTEARIADGLAAIRRGRTTIILTSSPALLAVTDRAVVVKDGCVVAEGTHTGLMASSEAYREAVS